MKHIVSWTQQSTKDESFAFLKTLALAHCLEGGEQGKHIAGCITSGDFLSVCNYGVDYEASTTWESSNCRQAIACFSKYEPLELGFDRERVAYDTMMKAEAKCKVTNELFLSRAQGSVNLEPWVEAVIFAAQSKIAHVLGNCPTFESLQYRFSKGATVSTKKSRSNASNKLGDGLSCTEGLLPFLPKILEQMPMLAKLHQFGGNPSLLNGAFPDATFVKVVNDKLAFVLKNAKTFRDVTTTGSVNNLVQNAIGDCMFVKLKNVGIDLRDQSINQKLACLGSITGLIATLDLENASNTIASELVFTLCSIDWAYMLDACSAKTVSYKGTLIQLERFASMGNGFTFPLQSLIFWALCSSASEDDFCSIYGDDIVVSTASVPRVMRVLEVCGLTVNSKKSYWTGSFRESCGGDFIRGVDIRPYYQKDLVAPKDLFRLHNHYVRRQDFKMAAFVKKHIHMKLRIYGPDGYGDGHLIGDFSPARHKRADSHGYASRSFSTYKETGIRDLNDSRPGDSLLPVYAVYTGKPVDCMPLVATETRRNPNGPFLRRYRGTSTSGSWSDAPEPIGEFQSGGECVKALTLPGTSGYKRVSVQFFDL